MAQEIAETDAHVEARATPTYQAGNETDFERLYQTSYGKIPGTITAMLGDRAAAEREGRSHVDGMKQERPVSQFS
jgi:hypothetical protein